MNAEQSLPGQSRLQLPEAKAHEFLQVVCRLESEPRRHLRSPSCKLKSSSVYENERNSGQVYNISDDLVTSLFFHWNYRQINARDRRAAEEKKHFVSKRKTLLDDLLCTVLDKQVWLNEELRPEAKSVRLWARQLATNFVSFIQPQFFPFGTEVL